MKSYLLILPAGILFYCIFYTREVPVNELWNTNTTKFLSASWYGMIKNSKETNAPKNTMVTPSKNDLTNISIRSGTYKHTKEQKRIHQKTVEVDNLPSNAVDTVKIYDERMKYYKNMCKKIRLTTQLRNVNRYVVDKTDRVKYIGVGKCGTRTWREIFHQLGREGKSIRFIETHSLKWKMENSSGKYFIFTFVRHPFSRLLSAFKNKLEHNRNSNYEQLRKEIVKKYRKVKSNKTKLPTFKEFIRFILDGGNLKDPHWIPIYLRIFACKLEYDFLGKVETFSQDTTYLMNRFSWRGLSTIWKNKSNYTNDKSKYFSQITKNELMRLYSLYRNDFLLFNYTISPYDSYVRK